MTCCVRRRASACFAGRVSRVANPTTQGVTLRGLSSSGASRTVVLADGVPLNDAFGGWVYWDRVPAAAIERVEVVRGAAGDLYGADALGGVIQMLTFGSDRPRLRASVDGGSRGTVRGSLFAGGRRRGWTPTGAVEWFHTDGAPVVAPEERGPVDVPGDEPIQLAVADARTMRQTRGTRNLRASAQTEKRGNGTPLQRNDTSWHQFMASAAGSGGGGLWTVQAGGGSQSYFQTFSSISASRDTERLTSDQRIPTTFMNGSAQWVRPFGRHSVLIGAEGHHTEAQSRRNAVLGVRRGDGALHHRRRRGCGSGLWAAEHGARVLGVHERGRSSGPVAAGVARHDDAEGRGEFPQPPRLGGVAAEGLAGRPWHGLRRASDAHAERTVPGVPRGKHRDQRQPAADARALRGRSRAGCCCRSRTSSLRVTGFSTRLSDAITNVTVSSTPALTVRERQNTDTVRASGLEIEAEFRPHPTLTITGMAVLTASRFVETPAQPALAGNLIPQVPRYQLGGSLTWVDPRWLTLTASARMSGAQFEDDLNTLELRRFVVADVSATREVVRRLQVFCAVENLFNAEYDTGRTPTRTIGWPRTARVGIRFYLP